MSCYLTDAEKRGSPTSGGVRLRTSTLQRDWKPCARTLCSWQFSFSLSPFISWEQIYPRNTSCLGLTHLVGRKQTYTHVCCRVDTRGDAQSSSQRRTQERLSPWPSRPPALGLSIASSIPALLSKWLQDKNHRPEGNIPIPS